MPRKVAQVRAMGCSQECNRNAAAQQLPSINPALREASFFCEEGTLRTPAILASATNSSARIATARSSRPAMEQRLGDAPTTAFILTARSTA